MTKKQRSRNARKGWRRRKRRAFFHKLTTYAVALAILAILTIMAVKITAKEVTYIAPQATTTTETLEVVRLEGSETPQEVAMVIATAEKYGVSPELAIYMARQESSFNPMAIGDLDIDCPHSDEAVTSRGLFQFSRCWYPHISNREAFDPEYATNKAMELIATNGKKFCRSQWTTCNEYYKQYRPKSGDWYEIVTKEAT